MGEEPDRCTLRLTPARHNAAIGAYGNANEGAPAMKKFMALYMARASAIEAMMKNAKPEDMKAAMDAWVAWDNANKSTIVELGAPLGKTKRIETSKVSDMKNEITGYSILQGDSAESVAKVFKGHPHLQHEGTWIELIEVMPLPSM
jgi:hypothetical protein